jgi:hypothetical protein
MVIRTLVPLVAGLTLATPRSDACEPPFPDVKPDPGDVVAGTCSVEIVNNTTWTGVDPFEISLWLVVPGEDPVPIEHNVEIVDGETMCLEEGGDDPPMVEFAELILTPLEPLPVGATVRVLEGESLLTEFSIGDVDGPCPDATVGNSTLGACVYRCRDGGPVECGVAGPGPAASLVLPLALLLLRRLRRRG